MYDEKDDKSRRVRVSAVSSQQLLSETREEHRKLAAQAAKQRAECSGAVPVQQAVQQVPSSLARRILEHHIAERGIPPPMDIITKEWHKANHVRKRRAAEARLADSYDALMEPLLELAAQASMPTEIIGASEVGCLIRKLY